MFLNSTSSLVPGDVILLDANTTKAACMPTSKNCPTWLYSPVQVVLVQKPLVDIQPRVTLQVASVLSPCSSTSIDVSNSVGSAGRSWAKIKYIVSGKDPTVVSAIQSYLTAAKMVISPPIPLPGSFFNGTQGVYTISVTMTNFLGNKNSASAQIIFVTDAVPTVVMSNPPLSKMYRSSTLTVIGDAYVQSCNTSQPNIRNQMSYSWKVTENNKIQNLVSYSPVSTYFALQPYSLLTNRLYTFELTVTYVPSGE